MERYFFEKLTPTKNANISIYDEAIEFVFKNSDVTNVAISGPYGAGKSSVVESYENKHKEKKFLYISLAHFKPIAGDGSDGVDETMLEGKILNQLIHQIPVDKIPQTNFRVKKDIGQKDVRNVTLFFCVLLGSAAFISASEKIKSLADELSDGIWKSALLRVTNNDGIILAGLAFCICLAVGIHYVVKMQINKRLLHKVTVQGNEIEIFENKDDSYFDKYLNEVLYLFEQVDADVIIFEDMDRFNSNLIFERLREVNHLVNLQKANKLKGEKSYKPLRFFYLLKDDIFVTKERTKFFDFIIPIVPVLDGSNSYDQFIRHLKRGNIYEKFDKTFLQRLLLYIDDMRVLKNVYNEFLVYMNRLNNTDLSWDKMLAMIVYKNVFPRDFCDLQLGRGYVHELFMQKEKASEEAIAQLRQEIQRLQEKIKYINKENLNDIQELNDVYELKYNKLPTGYYGRLTEESQLEKNKLDKEKGKRIEAIDNKNKGLLLEFETKIQNLENEISATKSKLLNELITRENADSIFMIKSINPIGKENEYKEIKGNDYFELLKFLISNGYIDETYNDYMTYFYEDSLSAHDKVFLRKITDKKGRNYEYPLKDVMKVLSSPVLRVVDFYEEETLNYDLLKGLLVNQKNPKYRNYLSALLKQIKDSKCIEFVSKYYESLQFDRTFIVELNKQWPEFFYYVYTNKGLPSEQMRRFSSDSVCLLDEQEVQDINVEGCLANYISEQSDYLNVSPENTKKMISQFCVLEVKFKTIEADTANTELFAGVYENNLYELSFENIRLMMKSMYKEVDSYSIEHRNYTVIQKAMDSPLAQYIDTNINKYAKEILKNCSGVIEDSEDAAIAFMNNESVEMDIREEYIKALTTAISDISAIQDKKFWTEMLTKEIIKETVSNIINYYKEYSLNSGLMKFINGCAADMDYSQIEVDFGAEITRQFFDSIAICNEMETSKYRKILCDIGYHYETYNAENIADDKMEVLIRNHVMEMNDDGLEYIRNNYKSHVKLYINQNVEPYLNLISADNFRYDEALYILGMDIEDNKKIALLELTAKPVSVVGKKYSTALIEYILDNNFDEHDERELYLHFSEYEKVVQSAIYRVAESRIDDIIADSALVLDDTLLSELLNRSRCSLDDKIQLWAKAIPHLTEETCKKHFDELGFPELKGIFTKRNNYSKTYEDTSDVREILNHLKKNTWIYDYRESNNGEGIVVIKNPVRDKKQ